MSPRKRDEPVRLTRIYTRGGDGGETSLGDGSRVSKLDPLVRPTAPSTSSTPARLGLLRGGGRPAARIQNELFDLGADLSVPYAVGDGRLRVAQSLVDGLEADCDAANASLPELTSFVLPGGNEAAARLHVARAVCRRAELEVVDAGRAAAGESARGGLPEPALRSALHPRPPLRGRRPAALEAGRYFWLLTSSAFTKPLTIEFVVAGSEPKTTVVAP